ncbi:pectinesterase-like [Ricinus communis]|uniref:pectinesterase-like n=1 Tax=Ricinus communis TaxID=3988 RepID=UPI0007728BE3|nr:pectinesterase-like [Ricinus communis]|eukprot:XP_015570414.1 pectinesterase-like [Ricinus communis]
MAFNLSILSAISLFLFLILFSPCLANFSTSTSGAPQTFCNFTPHPSFCKSSLPSNKSGNIHDYGRFSIHQTLSHARKLLSLVQYFLRLPSIVFPSSTIGALQDCKFLTQLNIDSLSYTLRSINYTNTLQSLEASDLQTLLSASLTNLQTCLDGLQVSRPASGIIDSLLGSLSNGTKHCSISLAFFTHGWIPATKKGRFLLSEREHTFSNLRNSINDGLPLRMSKQDQEIYQSVNKRKLLQATVNTSVLVNQVVIVDRKGSGNFTTINDAVAAAPNNTDLSGGYFLIYVKQGQYKEYVSIPSNKKNIMMIGDGIGRTEITGNRSVVDGWTTFNSATFAVVGQGFVAVNITFRNTAGAIKHQAVAVRNGADMSAFYSCGFEGYQDTLYTHSLRQFYRDCEIYGTIDYIFGNAAVVFQNCRINSRLPLNNQFNAITAQGRTDPNQNTGISIQNCSIKEAKDLATSNLTIKTYLGRPWKEYSRTIFMQSYIASLIDPAGWTPWSGDFALATLYYAEFNNTGVGSRTDNRVTWAGYHVINATDAANFTVTKFVQGDSWLQATGVPYSGGLM